MQTTLDALEKALAPIEHIGREETTFEADGVKVSLRVMIPEEENEVQRYATKALPAPLGDDEGGGEATSTDQLDYIERFKVAVLSHALVAVGEADFRDLKFVETGEELDNGQKIKIEKHVAMRRILHKWSGALRTLLFQKYAELLDIMEKKAEEAIEFEPSDIDTEIERLEKRLEKLREKKEKGRSSIQGSMKSQIEAINEMEKPLHGDDEDVAPPEEETTTPKAPTPPPPAREPIVPTQAAAVPPPQRPQEPPKPPEGPTPIPEDVLPPQAAGTHVPPEMEGSLVDTSDPDNLRSAVAEEEARIIARRRQQQEMEQAEAEARAQVEAEASLEGPADPASVRRPPHADAAEIDAAVGSFTDAGEVNGVQAFRLPPEPLTRSASQTAPPPSSAGINQVKPQGSRNPRFRSPGQK